MHYHLWEYFVKLAKIWHYCENLAIRTFQQIHTVVADTDFSVGNQAISLRPLVSYHYKLKSLSLSSVSLKTESTGRQVQHPYPLPFEFLNTCF